MQRHNPTRFQCNHCDRSFIERYKLTLHMTQNHPDLAPKKPVEKDTNDANVPQPKPAFECPVCHIEFGLLYHLKRHMGIHSNYRPFKCDTCQGTYKSEKDLNRHKKIHSGVKPHKCTFCGNGFVTTTELTRHVRIHTGEKPYKCEICFQAFTQTCTLKKHKEKKHPNVTVQEPPPTLLQHQQQQQQQQEQHQVDRPLIPESIHNMTTVQEILDWIGQQPPGHETSETAHVLMDYE